MDAAEAAPRSVERSDFKEGIIDAETETAIELQLTKQSSETRLHLQESVFG